jgi:hypothetical protein
MKTILIKYATLSNEQETSYKVLIKDALDTMPEGGFTMKDFRERGRIEDAMNDQDKSFGLEDYDVNVLKKIVNSVKWARREPFFFEFLEYIDKL